MLYEISYEYPIGSGKIVRHNVPARTAEEAIQRWGVSNNPSLKARVAQEEIDKAYVEALRENVQRNRSTAAQAAKKRFIAWTVTSTTALRDRLIEHIKAQGALAVECTPASYNALSAVYPIWSGCLLPVENRESVWVIDNPRKWGTEYRVTFPIPEFELPELDASYQTMFSGGAGRFTLNSVELFELMVREGMRL